MKKPINHLTFSLLVLSILCLSFCKKDSSPADAKTLGETDTRILVKEAFAKMDKMKMDLVFNFERAEIIKSKLDAEQDGNKRLSLTVDYAFELLKCGKYKESIELMSTVTKYLDESKIQVDTMTRQNLYSREAISYLRYGEIENCLNNHNHQSCYLPIQGDGVHQLPYGSTQAIEVYTKALKEFPTNLEFRYLLNIAYMTLGKYPSEVPKKYLINPKWFSSRIPFPKYKDIAPEMGLNRNSNAGGVIMDDFTNDGWLDLIITSWSPRQELIFYVNNGDGTFTDRTAAYNLQGQLSVLQCDETDFNNDGWMDILLLRGGWWHTQGDIPKTLLMNTGKGSFEDVTIKAGITKVGASQSAAWADYNLDGWVDLFIAYESLPKYERGIDLYINQKDGTFKNEAAEWGLTQNKLYKGVTAVYANDDKYPDIYLSALKDSNTLLINNMMNGQKGFSADNTVNMGAPYRSFPCWAFDYDNDGREDVFISSFNNVSPPSISWMKSKMGTANPADFPKLYRNKGNMQFEEVGQKMGLTEIAFTMGSNFGDLNTDGFLDFYLGTGNPEFQSLVPNKVYLNMDGKYFEDISYAGGFANIQKGHGVGFGDLDHDGDEDFYVVIGGAFDGDMYYNSLFENPNPDHNNWVVLKLTGTTANKAAIGARVALDVQENGKQRMIYQKVTAGSSFGGNSLALEVGLRKATSINKVTVQWPCKDCADQVFNGMTINKAYELIQDQPAPKELPYSPVKMHGKEGKMMHDHQMSSKK